MRLALAAVAASFLATGVAQAATITFVPPTDPVGRIWSTDNNDGYAQNRGIVLTPTADFQLTGVGLYHNLREAWVNWSVETAGASTGFVGGGTSLVNGGQFVFTDGLEFVDFGFKAVTLKAGTAYNIVFQFNGIGWQNFFYDQSDAQTFAQDGFTGIDGFQGYETANYVMPAIRIQGSFGSTSAVPEPATWAMLILGFGLVGTAMRRRSAALAA